MAAPLPRLALLGSEVGSEGFSDCATGTTDPYDVVRACSRHNRLSAWRVFYRRDAKDAEHDQCGNGPCWSALRPVELCASVRPRAGKGLSAASGRVDTRPSLLAARTTPRAGGVSPEGSGLSAALWASGPDQSPFGLEGSSDHGVKAGISAGGHGSVSIAVAVRFAHCAAQGGASSSPRTARLGGRLGGAGGRTSGAERDQRDTRDTALTRTVPAPQDVHSQRSQRRERARRYAPFLTRGTDDAPRRRGVARRVGA